VESPHTLPLLGSDRETSLDVDIDAPSSPLPPSSPLLSLVSFSVTLSVSAALYLRGIRRHYPRFLTIEAAIMDVPQSPIVDDDVSFHSCFR
jgi:hypothetical protein